MIAVERSFGAAKGIVFQDDAQMRTCIASGRGLPAILGNKSGAEFGDVGMMELGEGVCFLAKSATAVVVEFDGGGADWG